MPELRPYQRVLALINFDALDIRTAEKALLLARLNRAKLDFLHLIEPDGALDGGYTGRSPRDSAKSLEMASLRRLDFLVAQLGAGEAICHAVYGPLRQGFLAHVGKWQPDLVVSAEHRDYLSGAHDVLILSPSRRPQRGKALTHIARFFSALTGPAGA